MYKISHTPVEGSDRFLHELLSPGGELIASQETPSEFSPEDLIDTQCELNAKLAFPPRCSS
jgi:hypothetical protein